MFPKISNDMFLSCKLAAAAAAAIAIVTVDTRIHRGSLALIDRETCRTPGILGFCKAEYRNRVVPTLYRCR